MTAYTQWVVLVLDGPVLEVSTTRFRDRVLARLGAHTLDRRLADGEPPEAGRLLAVRAAMTGTVAARRRLADCWQELLSVATRANVRPGARVPLARSQILAARPEIDRLMAVLTDERPVAARGVAMASLLLTEPSPVYRVGRPDTTLSQAVEEVIGVLADD